MSLPISRPQIHLGFNNSSTTSWIFTPEHPCIARFGPRGYEITVSDQQDGHDGRLWRDGQTLQQWDQFRAKLFRLTGGILPNDAMPFDLHARAFETGVVDSLYPLLYLDVATLNQGTEIYRRNPWTRTPFSLADVSAAIEARRFQRKSVKPDDRLKLQIERIAYLATTPDLWDPIDISFGPDGSFNLQDGKHRLAAAIYLGRTNITACYEGYPCGLAKRFPGAHRLVTPPPTASVASKYLSSIPS